LIRDHIAKIAYFAPPQKKRWPHDDFNKFARLSEVQKLFRFQTECCLFGSRTKTTQESGKGYFPGAYSGCPSDSTKLCRAFDHDTFGHHGIGVRFSQLCATTNDG
jgi:hypothetical protein